MLRQNWDVNSLRSENIWARKLIDKPASLAEGISVIIPSYDGATRIQSLLESFLHQTLRRSAFEVVIVLNGVPGDSVKVIESFRIKYSDFNLRWFMCDSQNVSNARNIGIRLASRRFATFVDDDDAVEKRFLEIALDNARRNNIVLLPINNIVNGCVERENALNIRIMSLSGRPVQLSEVPWVLGFNACKIVATSILQKYVYQTELQSGEDVAYFANLLCESSLQVVVPDRIEEAAYLRSIREGSISRQHESYQFNVLQRIQVIRHLQAIEVPEENLPARESLERSQAGFIARYLSTNPGKIFQTAHDLDLNGIKSFPWQEINAGKARDLAISYCFPPFNDPSAIIAAKAIAERGKIVDVISCDLSEIRDRDESSNQLASRWIDHHISLDVPPSFSTWNLIAEFANRAVETAEAWAAQKGPYRSLYSRALWVGSHVAAGLYKLRNPDVYWTAEFSDPLRFGVDGDRRVGKVADDNVADALRKALISKGLNDSNVETSFDLVELFVFAFADELIFTNENQMCFMFDEYTDELSSRWKKKSVIRPHPQPSHESYYCEKASIELNSAKVNIGYFGSFYVNRGIGDVLTAFSKLEKTAAGKLALYIYTNNIEEVKQQVQLLGIQDDVFVGPYLPYLKFLNALTNFDVLLVNDAAKTDKLKVNPFLPSKYSDYKGSGCDIWAIVDEGSPLSQKKVRFKNSVNDVPGIVETLVAISEKGFSCERECYL